MKYVPCNNLNLIETNSSDPLVKTLRTMKKILNTVQMLLKKENCNDFSFSSDFLYSKKKNKNKLFSTILLFLFII